MANQSKLLPLPVYPDIILALHLLDTTPLRFHWIFYVQDSSKEYGLKFHAVDTSSYGGSWAYEKTAYTIINSQSVVAAAIIGRLDQKSVDDLDAVLKEIPMAVPDVDAARENKWTCRVWVREALRRMNEHGFIRCNDVDAMEAEMYEYGGIAAKEVDDNTFKNAKLVKARNSA